MKNIQEIDSEVHYKMGELISQIYSTLVILQASTEDKSIHDTDFENINNIINITTKNSEKLRKMIFNLEPANLK